MLPLDLFNRVSYHCPSWCHLSSKNEFNENQPTTVNKQNIFLFELFYFSFCGNSLFANLLSKSHCPSTYHPRAIKEAARCSFLSQAYRRRRSGMRDDSDQLCQRSRSNGDKMINTTCQLVLIILPPFERLL